MKVKSENEVAQWCPTLSHPMDCSLAGSSVLGIFQEWGAIAFSNPLIPHNSTGCCLLCEGVRGWGTSYKMDSSMPLKGVLSRAVMRRATWGSARLTGRQRSPGESYPYFPDVRFKSICLPKLLFRLGVTSHISGTPTRWDPHPHPFQIQRRRWHPTPVLLPGKSHGWRSLVGCSPWGG